MSRAGWTFSDGTGGLLDGAYLIRRALSQALEAAAAVASEGLPAPPAGCGFVLVDVGGRGRPYARLLSHHLSRRGYQVRHLVVDLAAGADVVGQAEVLPVGSGRADMVLCTQVLEHVADPQQAVREMARVLKPSGACLLTTHGTWFYHPDPEDYWRWTPAGLGRLFASAGFAQVSIKAVGGTRLALATLALTALARWTGEGLAGKLARRLLVAPANWAASWWLGGGMAGRSAAPGELVIDYLVTARRAPEEGPS